MSLLELLTQAGEFATAASELYSGAAGAYDKLHNLFNELGSTVNSIYGYFGTTYLSTPELMYARSLCFITSTRFMLIMQRLTSIDFSNKADRDIAFDLIQSLRTPDFNTRNRIPRNWTILSMFYPPYAEPYIMLLSAIAVPKNASVEIFENHRLSYGLNLSVLNKLFSEKNYYVTATFENKFNLILE